MTPAERFRELIDGVPPLDRQAVLSECLAIEVLTGDNWKVPEYILATGTEILRTTYPIGGSWRRKIRRASVVRRGITPREAHMLAGQHLVDELQIDETQVAIARPKQVPGLIVGWCIARGDTLVLCYTQEHLRRCGVQRMLMQCLYWSGELRDPPERPKYHLYQPRGSAEFLRRLGTEQAR